MLAGSHVALGAAAWFAAAPHLGRPPLDPEALALAVFGGLLPDMLGCGWLLRQGIVPARWAEPLVAGYLSHLLGDLLTPAGLRLLWPIRGTWALPFCRTGSPFEPLVVAVILVAAWSTLPEPPDARAALRRIGLCLGCAVEAPLPLPPQQPPPPKRRLAQPRQPELPWRVAGG